jgi:hypothetical protein
MVDGDAIKTFGLIGGGYLILREVSGLLGPPEWMQKDAEQVDEDMQREMENPDEISELEYEQHIIEYKEKYSTYYNHLDGGAREGIDSPDEIESQFDEQNLTKEERAWGWKSASNALITLAMSEERFDWDGIFFFVKVSGGIALGAIAAKEFGPYVRKSYPWAKENYNNVPETGTAVLGTPEFVDSYYGEEASQIIDEIPDNPDAIQADPIDSSVEDTPPETSGGTIGSYPVNDLLADVDGKIADRISQFIVGSPAGSVVVVTRETAEILADVTGASVTYFVENPFQTALLALFIVVFGALALSPEPLTTAIGVGGLKYGAGLIGVSISITAVKANIEDVKISMRVG